MSKTIKIKITEGGCDPCHAAAPLPADRHMAKIAARDKHMHTSDCEKPDYKNAHNNQEARMHRTTLAHLMADVKVLLDLVQDGDDLPEWLETKITKAGDYMSSAARYIAGNIARDQGQLEEAKNCGCGQDPCITYGAPLGTLEQIQEQNEQESISSMLDNIKQNLPSFTPEQLQQLVASLSTLEPESGPIAEEMIDLSESVLIESHFNLYEYLQDAVDEDNETPCPQCLYETLLEASCECPDLIPEAKYRGRKVKLNKPMRGDVKKFKVYVKDPKTGNIKKVNFGHGGSSARKKGEKTMKIRKSNKKARKSFRARHNCKNPGPKTKARYWSCRKW